MSKRILFVGLCCIDHINVVDSYPVEDTDQRVLGFWRQRGGNASNSSTYLSVLGADVEYMGLISTKNDSFIIDDFNKFGIAIDHCPKRNDFDQPTSCIILNHFSGTRTILHSNKNFPELTSEEFKALDFSQYSWIHFEGRNNVEEIIKMIKMIREWNGSNDKDLQIRISVELEKTRKSIEVLFDKGDVTFVSSAFAQMCGYETMQLAINGLVDRVADGTILICAWAAEGASATVNGTSTVHYSPSFPPPDVVNTLGAGDAFNGATIYALNSGKTLNDSISFGCRVAGAKCGILHADELQEKLGNMFRE